MLLKKPLILTLAMAFSVYCSNDNTQESSMPVLLALPLSALQCWHTEIFFPVRDALPEPDSMVKAIVTEIQQSDNQQREIIATARQRGSLILSRFRGNKKPEEAGAEGIEKEGEAIEWWELKQDPEANYSDMPRVCFGDDILLKPLLKSDSRYCLSPDPGVEAKAYRWVGSDDSADSQDSDSQDSDSQDSDSEDNGSEDSDTSDESSDNRPNEDEAGVGYVATTLNPFRASNESSPYCAILELKKIKQESASDSEIVTESEADVTKADSVNLLPADRRLKLHQCDHEGCNYGSRRTDHLKVHKRTHLPADQRPRIHQCDHEGCNYRSDRLGNLKMHKQTHLPTRQKPRVHQCNHEGCNYSANRSTHLKLHKQIHLPADQRLRVHRCDHEGCNYSTDLPGNLNKHKQTHLPADQRAKRAKVHRCDHEGCNYSTSHIGHLKKHKGIHLPADQRPKRHQCDHEGCHYSSDLKGNLKMHKNTHLPADQRPRVHQCDHESCNYRSDQAGNLKTHKQTHLPADQRPRRPKRKACNQQPSDEKRKKVDKE
ncbi:hypothetical protein [Endozoicomonas sp. 4G]|uniref:hypothetical protein n=1 Tax=Endozoicomonas sp. 4G TaxID=2872754 RepID=UPI00207897BF|nr:hypothetical protein [Endozoicomonas sp. 4G]